MYLKAIYQINKKEVHDYKKQPHLADKIMKDLPIYKLEINPEDETGVDFVALVNHPAIERNFYAFNHHQKFTANEERKIVTGPLMIPDQLIYRNDPQMGEYNVTYDKDTVENICLKFMKNQFTHNVNKEHKIPVNDVFMFESWISDKSRGINPPIGFENCPDGTWFGSYKINNEEIWNQVKDGTFKGFSIEGEFLHAKYEASAVEIINDILNLLN